MVWIARMHQQHAVVSIYLILNKESPLQVQTYINDIQRGNKMKFFPSSESTENARYYLGQNIA